MEATAATFVHHTVILPADHNMMHHQIHSSTTTTKSTRPIAVSNNKNRSSTPQEFLSSSADSNCFAALLTSTLSAQSMKSDKLLNSQPSQSPNTVTVGPMLIHSSPHDIVSPKQHTVFTADKVTELNCNNLVNSATSPPSTPIATSMREQLDARIAQVVDDVKTHLLNAVRVEVEMLKARIFKLEQKVTDLLYENKMLRQYAPDEVLSQLTAVSPPQSPSSTLSASSSTDSEVSVAVSAAAVEHCTSANILPSLQCVF